LADKLFNTEGIDPYIFRGNFLKAYNKPLADSGAYTYYPHVFGSDKVTVIFDCPNIQGSEINLLSDRSLVMKKVAEEKDFKFD